MSSDTIGGRKTVLIVDDEENVRTITSRLVAARGHDVMTAETGRQALDVLDAGGRPDLIVLDVLMPELDGLQTLVRIRNDLGLTDLPVVMLTAQRSDRDMLAGYGVGADYYLTKPLEFERLLNIVDYLIGDLAPQERARIEALL
jgi:CheY-like chemotaxis protein